MTLPMKAARYAHPCGVLPDLSKLEICFIVITLGHGGAQTQLFYMLRSLQESGANLRVLSLTHGELWEARFRKRSIPVAWVGQQGSRLKRLVQIVAALREAPPSIIHSLHFPTNLYAVGAARLLGVREVGSVQSDGLFDVRSVGRVGGLLSLRLPRVVAANSPAGMRNVMALGVPPERVYFLPNVMDTDHFRPATSRKEGPIQLLAVGRLSVEKRFDRFLSVVARLRRQSSAPVKGIIVGDGPARSQLEQQAAELGLLPDGVEFRGAVPDPGAVYREADILVLTSDWEGTPNVILEAMATGLPTVANGVGGVPDMIRDRETGYLVNAGDEDAMIAALLALGSSPQLRQRMGADARDYVRTHHSLDKLPALLGQLYQKVLQGARRC